MKTSFTAAASRNGRFLDFTIRLFYLPLFILGGNGMAIYLVQNHHSKLWLIGLLIVFVALAFLFEKRIPYDRAFSRPQGDRGRDFAHAIVNESLGLVGLLSVPLLAQLNPLPSLWPSTAPLWQQLVLAVFIADLGITLAHFASHRFNLLWRFHAIHHSVQRMYGFNGLMKHPLHQLIETIAGTTPLLLLGIPQDILMLLLVAVALQLLVQHSNVAYFTGPLKHLLVVNEVHRFHHLNSAAEGDVNFGLFTQVVDRLLGTSHWTADRKFKLGDLGIENQPDFPVGYVAELLAPFQANELVGLAGETETK